MSYKIITVGGYDFFECSSAFQKSIRRGKGSDAMYWCVELFNSGYDEYLWKRIKIIASEDVGLADNNAAILMASLYASYAELKKDNKDTRPERVYLTHAVLYLARAPKSRYVDLAIMASWRGHDLEKKKVPDYALDKHTARGKAMGRDEQYFLNEGAHCENFHPVEGEAKLSEQVKELIKTRPDKISFKTLGKKNKNSQSEIGFDGTD